VAPASVVTAVSVGAVCVLLVCKALAATLASWKANVSMLTRVSAPSATELTEKEPAVLDQVTV
jgi:hypothetical protein